MFDAKSTLAAAAVLSLTMVGSAVAAVPASNLNNVAKASTGIQHVFYRPLAWHRPIYGFYGAHRVWHRPLAWHRPIYGFYGHRVWHRPLAWHRPIYGFYGPRRVFHRWGWNRWHHF
jgi:hypothetical protein